MVETEVEERAVNLVDQDGMGETRPDTAMVRMGMMAAVVESELIMFTLTFSFKNLLIHPC
jgi:hypothetical protein